MKQAAPATTVIAQLLVSLQHPKPESYARGQNMYVLLYVGFHAVLMSPCLFFCLFFSSKRDSIKMAQSPQTSAPPKQKRKTKKQGSHELLSTASPKTITRTQISAGGDFIVSQNISDYESAFEIAIKSTNGAETNTITSKKRENLDCFDYKLGCHMDRMDDLIVIFCDIIVILCIVCLGIGIIDNFIILSIKNIISVMISVIISILQYLWRLIFIF